MPTDFVDNTKVSFICRKYHSGRRTFITRLIEEGANIKAVSHLGWICDMSLIGKKEYNLTQKTHWERKDMTHLNDEKNRFDKAWKQGVKKVGVEFFNLKAPSLELAEKRWQMEPNYAFINEAIGDYSHGKQVLMAMMYSFFDPECGQELLIKAGTPNFVDARSHLDSEAIQIISDLWSNHYGW